MRAFVLAAGYGTRLEPLTKAIPKPMVPIVNLPTMQHNIELLKLHGLLEITANIHYYPEMIESYFGDGNNFGVNLQYSYERQLMGTAGGVKKMAAMAGKNGELFVVLSSDALTDINLTKMIEYHKEKKALATLALSPVSDVKEFGIVMLDDNARITGFQEKPDPSIAMSDLANAGIYIFDPEILKLIPEGPYDFGKQLFPHLVEAGAPIYGYKMIEYWSDVGGLDKYIQSNYDAIKGAVKIRVPGIKTASATWVGERENIDNGARFEGSVIIGDRCKIGAGVRIKDSIIGDKCQVESGAVIEGSVIWSDTYIGTDAHLANSVIGNFCYVGDKSKIINSIIANRCLIPFATLLPPGSKIDPNSSV